MLFHCQFYISLLTHTDDRKKTRMNFDKPMGDS